MNQNTNTKINKKRGFRVFFRYSIFFCIILFSTFYFLDVNAESASFLFSPASGSFSQGEDFSIDLKLSTEDMPINAAHAIIYFPQEKVELTGISKDESIFSLWVKEPEFSNDLGKAWFLGGLPQPGFLGTGSIITLNFKAKQTGMVQLILGEGQILANDGQGADILTFIKEGKYLVVDKNKRDSKNLLIDLLSPTHPDQNEWYSNNNPMFIWNLIDKDEVSFHLDKEPISVPDDVSEGVLASKNYSNLEDGIWYFHLKIKNNNVWTEAKHYKAQIDTSPPMPFEVVVNNNGDITNPNPELYFETEDDLSGLSYYKVKIGDQDFSKVLLAQINPFVLSTQSPGTYPLIVRAVDRAGNNVESKALIGIEPIATPEIITCPAIYQAGKETLYFSGTSPQSALVNLWLTQKQNIIQRWQVTSDNQGEWSFSTKELFKTGTYYLFVQAKDERGALSQISKECKVEIILSGFMFGGLTVSFRDLIWLLLFILLAGIFVVFYFIFKSQKAVKELKKEIAEAQYGLGESFNELEKEIARKIEFLDEIPGFSKKEQRIYQSLRKDLLKAEQSISKDIKDIEINE